MAIGITSLMADLTGNGASAPRVFQRVQDEQGIMQITFTPQTSGNATTITVQGRLHQNADWVTLLVKTDADFPAAGGSGIFTIPLTMQMRVAQTGTTQSGDRAEIWIQE